MHFNSGNIGMLGILKHTRIKSGLNALKAHLTSHEQCIWNFPLIYWCHKKTEELTHEQKQGKERLSSGWGTNMVDFNPPKHCFMASLIIPSLPCRFSRNSLFCYSFPTQTILHLSQYKTLSWNLVHLFLVYQAVQWTTIKIVQFYFVTAAVSWKGAYIKKLFLFVILLLCEDNLRHRNYFCSLHSPRHYVYNFRGNSDCDCWC